MSMSLKVNEELSSHFCYALSMCAYRMHQEALRADKKNPNIIYILAL